MENEMATETLPIPRIEILQYYGFNGGFARSRTLLWKCVIVNASGQREFGGDWMSGGRGYPVKEYAEQDAEKWRKRTLWPVFDLGRQPKHDEAPRG
jgi:hypothetical protein